MTSRPQCAIHGIRLVRHQTSPRNLLPIAVPIVLALVPFGLRDGALLRLHGLGPLRLVLVRMKIQRVALLLGQMWRTIRP